MKVLIADDSETMRLIVHHCLDFLHVKEVVEVDDGTSALEALNHSTFDLIISDWNMPGMNGLELLTHCRNKQDQTPFIMMTSGTEREHVQSAILAGVSDYLVKPFTQDEVRDKLHKWLPILAEDLQE